MDCMYKPLSVDSIIAYNCVLFTGILIKNLTLYCGVDKL